VAARTSTDEHVPSAPRVPPAWLVFAVVAVAYALAAQAAWSL
jgi:hypothetical protein